MRRTSRGSAIGAERRTRGERGRLRVLLRNSQKRGDLRTWRRAKGVLGYLSGQTVMALSQELNVSRSSINRWLGWFDKMGTEGLKPRESTGRGSCLTGEQLEELASVIDAGPQRAGYQTGIWTGPMIGDLIHRRYGVKYHNHYIPRLLHKMGFSVQRPRKRLARADLEKQRIWLKTRLPAIKKSRCLPWTHLL